MFDFFHEFENSSVVIFIIHRDQLVVKKKNVVVKNNKFLKVFICLSSNFNIRINFESLHVMHQFVKRILNFVFENAHDFFDFIVF